MMKQRQTQQSNPQPANARSQGHNKTTQRGVVTHPPLDADQDANRETMPQESVAKTDPPGKGHKQPLKGSECPDRQSTVNAKKRKESNESGDRRARYGKAGRSTHGRVIRIIVKRDLTKKDDFLKTVFNPKWYWNEKQETGNA